MDDYAGRVLADRYRLPLPPSDAYEFAETRAFDTYSGQEVLVRQVPLPEVVEAEVVEEPAPGRWPGDASRGAGPTGGPRNARTSRNPRNPRNSRTTRAPSDPAVRRAIEAAEAAARIPDHPRLDQVFDVFAEGGSLWIVSEVVAARPLAALLAERPLSPYRAAEVASDVLTALRALHAHGWVHRNITVRTVLVCDDGRVLLTGLAAGAAEEALCGYDPVPDATGGFDGRAAGGTASGSVPGEPGATPAGRDAQAADRRGTAALEGHDPAPPDGRALRPGARAALPAPRGRADGAVGGGGSGGAAADGWAAGRGERAGGRPAGRGEAAGGGPVGRDGASSGWRPGSDGADAVRGGAVSGEQAARDGRALGGEAAGRGDTGSSQGRSERSGQQGRALPDGDVRAARAGAIAAYRAGVRSAAAARALPPGGESSPGGARREAAPTPPGQIADPYGVGGRPAARPAPEVRHLSAGPAAAGRDAQGSGAARPGGTEGPGPYAGRAGTPPDPGTQTGGARPGADGSSPDASSGVAWHGAGRRIPGQHPGAAGDPQPDSGGNGDGYGPEVPYPGTPADGLSTGGDSLSPGGEGLPIAADGLPEGADAPYPGADALGSASTSPRTASGLPQYADQITPATRAPHPGTAPHPTQEPAAPEPASPEPPSHWDDLAGVSRGGGRGATPLELERARQARMAVVGAVTERWAPEQAGPVHENWQLAAPIGPATDLWALGALLFRAVQGHAPYPEDSTYELVQLVCAEPPAFAEECGPLRPVVESLLRQDPTERPDIEELRGWLRSLVRSAPEAEAGAHVVPAPAYDRTRLPVVRRRGELVRKRRGRRNGKDAQGGRDLPEQTRHKHKKGRAPKRRGAPEQHRAALAAETAPPRAPERPGRERMSPSAEKWERQQQRQMRQMSRARQGGGSGGPKRLGRMLLLLILLGVAAAVAYAMYFMPKAGTADSGAGTDDRKDRAGSASSAPQEPGGHASPDGGGEGAEKSGPPPEKETGEPSKEPDTPADGLPQGFVLRKDTEGFQLAVASGWDRTPANGRSQIVYRGGAFSLTVVPGRDSTADYGDDPLAYQREDERELQPFRDSTWATSSGLRRVEVGRQVRAEGQFTWDEGDGKMYVRNAAIIIDGAYHVVLVKGPESERDEVTRLFEQAVKTYKSTR